MPTPRHILDGNPDGAKADTSAFEAQSGHETVLLVEDEPELLEMIGEVLQMGGYHVLPASSGKKALEVWGQSHPKIDLLVTDLKMPDGVGGVELARLLVADNPDLKVLYTSGYDPLDIEPDIHVQEGLNYLQKPYRPERLLSTIRNCLENDCGVKRQSFCSGIIPGETKSS